MMMAQSALMNITCNPLSSWAYSYWFREDAVVVSAKTRVEIDDGLSQPTTEVYGVFHLLSLSPSLL